MLLVAQYSIDYCQHICQLLFDFISKKTNNHFELTFAQTFEMGFLQRRILAFKHAIRGIALFFETGAHARIHGVAAIFVVTAGWYFGLTTAEWLVILLCIMAVLVSEMFNSAIEYLTDLASPMYHELARKTKDIAAGAVLAAAISAATAGLIIFLPKIFALT